MTFGSEIHSFFQNEDGLVDINEVSRVSKAAQESVTEIVQITRLVNLAIRSEYRAALKGEDVGNVVEIFGR